jgi:hypothetical protein
MRTDISIIYSCVQELPERERVILIEYYGLASRHNITREQVRALKARAECRIRRRINVTRVL